VLRKRQEDGVRLIDEHIEIEPIHRGIPQALQCGHVPARRARRSHGGRNTHARVPAQQAQQLDAGISGRSSDSNPNCSGITIHQNV
jgi:hypothetical protein